MAEQPTAVILGASRDQEKFGNKSVRAHLRNGYQVFPVNPSADEIERLPAFASLEELPTQTVNRISIYLPPKVLLPLLPQIANLQVEEVFLNPGSESEEVITEAERLGIPIIQACSIIDVGDHPSDL